MLFNIMILILMFFRKFSIYCFQCQILLCIVLLAILPFFYFIEKTSFVCLYIDLFILKRGIICNSAVFYNVLLNFLDMGISMFLFLLASIAYTNNRWRTNVIYWMLKCNTYEGLNATHAVA